MPRPTPRPALRRTPEPPPVPPVAPGAQVPPPLPPGIPGGNPGEGRTTSVQTNAIKPLFANQVDPPPERPHAATSDERESTD